jgi:hypothetical protein
MDPDFFIEHTPEYYRHVATNAHDEVLVRLCLLLAAAELAELRASIGERERQSLPAG